MAPGIDSAPQEAPRQGTLDEVPLGKEPPQETHKKPTGNRQEKPPLRPRMTPPVETPAELTGLLGKPVCLANRLARNSWRFLKSPKPPYPIPGLTATSFFYLTTTSFLFENSNKKEVVVFPGPGSQIKKRSRCFQTRDLK